MLFSSFCVPADEQSVKQAKNVRTEMFVWSCFWKRMCVNFAVCCMLALIQSLTCSRHWWFCTRSHYYVWNTIKRTLDLDLCLRALISWFSSRFIFILRFIVSFIIIYNGLWAFSKLRRFYFGRGMKSSRRMEKFF